MAVALALGAAMSWGVADFLGGMTSRRADEVRVAVLSQIAGLALLAVALPLAPGTASAAALGWGALAGVGGAVGVTAYFRALAIGPMGVTAPLAALVGASVPVSAGLLAGERPGALAVLGVVAGLAAVVLVTRSVAATPVPGAGAASARQGVVWALVAGAGFGWFFVGLDLTPADSGMWPLLGARVAGVSALALLLAVRRSGPMPGRAVGVVLVSGLLDMAANVLFLVAVREGMLVLVSVLTSLYPVGVVLLARATLGERLSRPQMAGIALALGATALIAV